LDKLKEHGVRYIRTLPPNDDPTSPLGRSYQNSWNVSSPEELDKKLASISGCEWNWHPNGDVTIISEPIAAVRLVSDHIQNSVHQWTFCNSLVAAFLGWQDSRNDRTKALRFGNNDPMDLHVLQSIADFMVEHRVLYTWRKGDILAIQNQLVMHSREPFKGTRRVLASIWGPPQDESVIREQPNTALGLRPSSYFDPIQPSDPLVFGFWKVGKDICEEVAYAAILNGYRRLDCACDYGNEVEVGRGIKRAIKEGLVERKDLFLTSKLWNTYHKAEHVKLACQKSMNDLGVDYLDEYLIHFPISMEFIPFEQKYPPEWTNMDGKMVLVPNDMCATWRAMEELVDQGLVRKIGVCNFSTQLLRQIISTCRIRPTTLQIEVHPHNSQEHLVRFAREAGIHVTAFSIFGASSYLELNMATEADLLLTNPVVTQIAESHRKTPAQVLIRWAIQRNIFPLCKTCNSARMKENRQVTDFYLYKRDMLAINALNMNRRYNDPGAFCEPGMGTFCPIYE
jgi:D-xylose reductase